MKDRLHHLLEGVSRDRTVVGLLDRLLVLSVAHMVVWEALVAGSGLLASTVGTELCSITKERPLERLVL